MAEHITVEGQRVQTPRARHDLHRRDEGHQETFGDDPRPTLRDGGAGRRGHRGTAGGGDEAGRPHTTGCGDRRRRGPGQHVRGHGGTRRQRGGAAKPYAGRSPPPEPDSKPSSNEPTEPSGDSGSDVSGLFPVKSSQPLLVSRSRTRLRPPTTGHRQLDARPTHGVLRLRVERDGELTGSQIHR